MRQSLGRSHSHAHSKSNRLSQKSIILQSLVFAQHFKIEQEIFQALLQNPALRNFDEVDSIDKLEQDAGEYEWNDDFDRPIDEWETGETTIDQDDENNALSNISDELEQAALNIYDNNPKELAHAFQCIDHYRTHGMFPQNVDSQLHETALSLEKTQILTSALHTAYDFEVEVEQDKIEVYVVPIGNGLYYINKIKGFSVSAKNLIKIINDRNTILCNFGDFVFKNIQKDFFLSNQLEDALRALIPVSVEKISEHFKNSPFKIDKKYVSKLGDHLVKSKFGILPLNVFLSNKAQLIRIWVGFAYENGIVKEKQQLEFITRKISERLATWDEHDMRHEFSSPLKEITIVDIKNARRYVKGRNYVRK